MEYKRCFKNFLSKSTTGNWHIKKRDGGLHKFKKYRTTACKTCAALKLCTAKADGKREIERSEYAEATELNNKNYKELYGIYRKRQEINSLSRKAGNIYLVQ